MNSSSYLRRSIAGVVLLTSVGLAACKSSSSSTSKTDVAQTVVVISQADVPSQIVTEVYALALQNSGE